MKMMGVLFLTLLFVFFLSTGKVAAETSIKNHGRVTTLQSRGGAELEAKYSYTPKFIVGKTRVEAYDKDGKEVDRKTINDQFFKGEGVYFNSARGTVNEGTVIYRNMGEYEGKNVNIRLKMSSTSPKVAVGTDENTFLMTFGFSSQHNGEKIDVSLEFFDDEDQAIELSGNWTFSAVNGFKKLRFKENFFDKAYVLSNTKIKYNLKEELIELIGEQSGDINGDHTYLTMAFSKQSFFDYSYECVNATTYAVRFDPTSLASIPELPLFVKGEIIPGQYRENKRTLFTYTQRVPYTDKVDYLKSYQLSVPLDPAIERTTNFLSDVTITDSLGKNRKADFDITVVSNRLEIKAKAAVLTEPRFYDKIYEFSLVGKTADKDYFRTIKLPLEGTVTFVRNKAVSKTFKSTSNKAETVLESSTAGDVTLNLERELKHLKFTDVVVKDKVDFKYEALDIKYPSNYNIHFTESFITKNKWNIIKNENNAKGMNSLTFGMKSDPNSKKNDAATIKEFLKDNIYFEVDGTSEKATKETVSVRLLGEVIIERKGEDDKSHYYKFVPDVMPWLAAYNTAKKERYKNLQGYLLTITSEEEHDFVFKNIAKNPGWLGGTRMVQKQKGSSKMVKIMDEENLSEDITKYEFKSKEAEAWYWADGPEAGRNFFSIRKYEPKSPLKGKIPGVYEAFRNPSNYKDKDYYQPDNSNAGKGEYVLQFAQNNTKYWNDLHNEFVRYDGNLGYYVEFSEYGDQKEDEFAYQTTLVLAEADIPKPVRFHYRSTSGKTLKESTLYGGNYKIGKVVIPPGEPILNHYEYPISSHSSGIIGSATPIDIVYTYEPTKYKVIYDANGGTGKIPSQEFTIENETVKLAGGNGFSRKGYLQTRWQAEKTNPTTFYDFDQTVTFNLNKGDVTLYADWKEHNAEVQFDFYLKNTAGELVLLKDLDANQGVVGPKTKVYPVQTPLTTILADPSIKQNYNYYQLLKTRYQVGTKPETTVRPTELTIENLRIKRIYQGTLGLQVPKELTFKSKQLLSAPLQNIELNSPGSLKVINTKGQGGNWQVKAELVSMMKRGERPLLGSITYRSSNGGEAITLQSGMQKIETSQSDQIDTSLPLQQADKGLRLNVKSGNLFGKYGQGIIKWEVGDYPTP